MSIVRKGLKMLREEGVSAFIKKTSSYMLRNSLRYILTPFIAKKFRNSVRSIDNIYDALDFAFSFQAFGVSIKPI